MNKEEENLRRLNLNAHFAWAFAMWGSADIAREGNNFLLAPIGYYYAVFHSGFALANTNHTIQFKSFQQVGHSQLVSWLPIELTIDFNILREVRETVNYLGAGNPVIKAGIVRGHPFGYTLGSKQIDFFDSINDARERSLRFIHRVLDKTEVFCEQHSWGGPRRGDDNWQMNFLDDDFLLHVIPRDKQGSDILLRALSILDLGV